VQRLGNGWMKKILSMRKGILRKTTLQRKSLMNGLLKGNILLKGSLTHLEIYIRS